MFANGQYTSTGKCCQTCWARLGKLSFVYRGKNKVKYCQLGHQLDRYNKEIEA